MNTKAEISGSLKELLLSNKSVIAVWEGGSTATGYHDDYSDLDLAIVCSDSAVEDMFVLLDNWLEDNYGIKRKFRVPEPAWHGFSQCYYQIADVPEFLYLDISVLKRSLPEKFTESDRHGNAVIWFEKEPVIDTTPTPFEQVQKKAERFYQLATQADFITITEVRKAIARNNFSEAFPVYYQFIARNLGIMLNLKYRPVKVDFGLRYGYRDYEKSDVELLESSFKINSLEELALKFTDVENRFQDLKSELFDKYGS